MNMFHLSNFFFLFLSKSEKFQTTCMMITFDGHVSSIQLFLLPMKVLVATRFYHIGTFYLLIKSITNMQAVPWHIKESEEKNGRKEGRNEWTNERKREGGREEGASLEFKVRELALTYTVWPHLHYSTSLEVISSSVK